MLTIADFSIFNSMKRYIHLRLSSLLKHENFLPPNNYGYIIQLTPSQSQNLEASCLIFSQSWVNGALLLRRYDYWARVVNGAALLLFSLYGMRGQVQIAINLT